MLFYRQIMYNPPMTISYIISNYKDFPISSQQETILEYAKTYQLSIDSEKIFSIIDEKEIITYLKDNLDSGDLILVDCLWVFGDKIGKIIQALNCLIKRQISIHLCKTQVVIDQNLPISIFLDILNSKREAIIKREKSLGRPKGSLSKSKFDIHKECIIKFLREGKNVSKISLILEISRSSLKDYINSRNLKEIALIDNSSQCKLESKSFKLPEPNCHTD